MTRNAAESRPRRSSVQFSRYRNEPDRLLALAVLVIMLTSTLTADSWQLPAGWATAVIVLNWLPLTVRARWPFAVWLVVFAMDTVHIVVAGHADPPSAPVPVATMLALYTIASRYSIRTSWTLAGVSGAGQFTASVLSYGHAGQDWLYLNWVVVATALGRLIQERRRRIAAAEFRAETAERSKQAEADRQVTAERIRIARELHDVLAHHITVVNAQASVAQYLLQSDPKAASAALAGIATNSKAALDELRAALGLLRTEGDDPAADTRAPAPTTEHLARLLDSFTDAGMHLVVTVDGERRPLAGPADLAFYRIVQEALTNATKHAPGSVVALDIAWSAQRVRLAIANSKPTAETNRMRSDGTGHGLIGMRERAAAAGGSATAAPTGDGGYRVCATLPVVTDAADWLSDIAEPAGLRGAADPDDLTGAS